MRISSARIENFRALEDVTCAFDDVTTFIGPNGAGKSSILRALDWFFNGAKGALGDADRYSLAAAGSRIRVRVDFGDLAQADRDALGEKYAPAGVDSFTAWRTIEESGEEKITAKAMAFLPFETVRAAVGVPDKKAALALARSQHPDLDLPPWTTIAGTGAAMDEWERQHPEELTESEVSDTHFFGFYGQGKLSGIFDFVFVSADLRAGEESLDTRDSITGRILQRAIDREPFNQAVNALVTEFTERHHKLGVEHLDDQLGVLARELTEEVGRFTKGRSVVLAPGEMDLRPQPPRIALSIQDGGITTPVTSQGHGFQRTLLIAALDILARHGTSKGETGTICLAIEEPELFQHPTQAKAFASVLRSLATNPNDRVQVLYATHSPYFVEPTYFDNVRRVVREATLGQPPVVRVRQASMEVVADRLKDFDSRRSVVKRFEQICLRTLPEALFADAVIIVEGDDDAAILQGACQSPNQLAIQGVAVAVAGGKTNVLLPHAILKELGVKALCVIDNDKGHAERMRRDTTKDATDIDLAELETSTRNRSFCRYFGVAEEDYPEGVVSEEFVAMPDTLESTISLDWPEWAERKSDVVKEGRGVDGKNAATYALAAKECTSEPTGTLGEILDALTKIA